MARKLRSRGELARLPGARVPWDLDRAGRCGPCLLEQRCSKPTFRHSEFLIFVRTCIDRLLFSPRRTLRGMFQRQSPSQEECGVCVLGNCAFARTPPKHVGHTMPLDRRTAAFNWFVVRRPPQFSRPWAVLALLLSNRHFLCCPRPVSLPRHSVRVVCMSLELQK